MNTDQKKDPQQYDVNRPNDRNSGFDSSGQPLKNKNNEEPQQINPSDPNKEHDDKGHQHDYKTPKGEDNKNREAGKDSNQLADHGNRSPE